MASMNDHVHFDYCSECETATIVTPFGERTYPFFSKESGRVIIDALLRKSYLLPDQARHLHGLLKASALVEDMSSAELFLSYEDAARMTHHYAHDPDSRTPHPGGTA